MIDKSLAWPGLASSLVSLIPFGAAALVSFGAAALAGDDSAGAADIIAEQIRRQGYHCEKALSAEHDAKQSRPNAAVWHLTCSDGAYRVVLVPDLAAHVEPVDR